MARNQELRVKLTKEELEKIRNKAEDLGVEPSVYLRIVGLKSQLAIECR